MTAHDPLGPVQITPRDIYDALVALRSSVERLADQAVGAREDLADHEQRLRLVEDVRPGPRLKELEERVRSVESRLWPLPSLAAVVSVAALTLAAIPMMR